MYICRCSSLDRPRPGTHPSRRPRAFALPGIICEFEGVNLRFSGAIAVLRAVRPLVALSIVPSMKLVMTGLTSAIFGVAVGCTDARSGRARGRRRLGAHPRPRAHGLEPGQARRPRRLLEHYPLG